VYCKLSILTISLVLGVGCESKDSSSAPNRQATPTVANSVKSDGIPDLPDYPGAKRTEYTTGRDAAGGFTAVTKVVSTTSDPDEQVNAFFGKSLKDHGWQIVNVTSSVESVAEGKERMTLAATKGTSEVKIEVDQKGKGNVIITVERKDR
jgi:hypothetical protein